MEITFFEDDHGRPSSWRGKSKMFSFNVDPLDSSYGGMTTHVGGFTSRFNNHGQCIGTGYSLGGRSTYIGSDGYMSDHLETY